MKKLTAGSLFIVFCVSSLSAAPCVSASLSTYLNGGGLFSCTENSGDLTIGFNNTLLPSYAGLSLLSLNNTAVLPASITVAPGSPGLDFRSNSFSESSALLSSQSELVQFTIMSAATTLSGTTFSLDNAQTGTGGLGLGTGLAIGQELVCLGGSFTSLPVGLVTSVANGVLNTGTFGCSGTVLIGTAATSSGPLNGITSVLGLPDLTGVTDQAVINFGTSGATFVDVIKLQALLSLTGGSASTDGFGNSFSTVAGTPEPASALLLTAGLALILARKRCAVIIRRL